MKTLNYKSSASGCCLAFTLFFANFNLMMLMKVLLIKKCVIDNVAEYSTVNYSAPNCS